MHIFVSYIVYIGLRAFDVVTLPHNIIIYIIHFLLYAWFYAKYISDDTMQNLCT